MGDTERCIGLTTTVPVEAVLAAGFTPVDLNNLFVCSTDRDRLVETALGEGFPQNTCVWLKGIFGAVVSGGYPRKVIGVVRGDCSGTEVLLEAFEMQGVEVIPFSYPFPPSREDMERELFRLCERLGTSMESAEAWRLRLLPVRELLAELDRLCWSENLVSGLEGHLWLVSSSDFNGNPDGFLMELRGFIDSVRQRESLDRRETVRFRREVRLGYIGVPPVNTDIFELAEQQGARFVFHEVQRQFSMPTRAGDLVEQYLMYTYPYRLAGRAVDIEAECRRRHIDGLVHYVQSFCHRNLEDVVFGGRFDIPMITLECDCPGGLGAPARSRLENFIQVLGENAR